MNNIPKKSFLFFLQRVILFTLLLLFIFYPECTIADTGRIHATSAKVSEDGQKAIILHNFREEILILETDLKADNKTGIIRFIPFPSEPVVSLAPEKTFERVETIIKNHELKFVTQSKSGTTGYYDVELRSFQKMGSHNIAVVKVNNSSHFKEWVNNFFKQKGLPVKSEYPDIESIVADYVKRGINWFVFDYVEVLPVTKTVEPLAYRFQTKELYYPLKTSNTYGGSGTIDLILITPATLFEPLFTYYSGCFGLPDMKATTSSEIMPYELTEIIPEPATFFKRHKIFMQLASYRGKYEFSNDIFSDFLKGKPYALWHEDDEPNFLDGLNETFPPKATMTYTFFEPKAKYFTLKVPRDWNVSEINLMKENKTYEVILSAPGTKDMEFVTISAKWVAEATKTAEGYLFELQNPAFRPPYRDIGPVTSITVAGKPAWRLETKNKRTLLSGSGENAVESVQKYLVIPQKSGYFELRYDAALDNTRAFVWLFDEVVKSFAPGIEAVVKRHIAADLSDEEYNVYTGFLKTSKKGSFPEYLDDYFGVTKAYSITSTLKKGKTVADSLVKKWFGKDGRLLYADYIQKNKMPALVKDKIRIQGFSILTEEERQKIIDKEGLQRVPSSALFSEVVYLSRVGFNPNKSRALFHISNNWAPGTSFYVVMHKQDDEWVYENAYMDEYLIY